MENKNPNPWRVAVAINGTLTEEQSDDLARLTQSFVTTVRPLPERGHTEVTVTIEQDGIEAATTMGLQAVAEAVSAAGLSLKPVGINVMTWDAYEAVLNAPPVDLIGAAEAAEILGVSRARVHQLAKAPTFPEPLYELAAGKLWDRAVIEEYARKPRKEGRPRTATKEAEERHDRTH